MLIRSCKPFVLSLFFYMHTFLNNRKIFVLYFFSLWDFNHLFQLTFDCSKWSLSLFKCKLKFSTRSLWETLTFSLILVISFSFLLIRKSISAFVFFLIIGSLIRTDLTWFRAFWNFICWSCNGFKGNVKYVCSSQAAISLEWNLNFTQVKWRGCMIKTSDHRRSKLGRKSKATMNYQCFNNFASV